MPYRPRRRAPPTRVRRLSRRSASPTASLVPPPSSPPPSPKSLACPVCLATLALPTSVSSLASHLEEHDQKSLAQCLARLILPPGQREESTPSLKPADSSLDETLSSLLDETLIADSDQPEADVDDPPKVDDDSLEGVLGPQPPNKATKTKRSSKRSKSCGKSLSSPPEFKCQVCQKSFASKGNLTKHSVRHSAVQPFACGDCGAGFNQKRDLKTHIMQKHTGERPHVCELCGKGFVHKFYLTEHMGYHTGAKRHQCYICGKNFSSSSILAKHIGRHRGRRDYKCNRCNKTFVVKHDLTSHVKYVHERLGRDSDKPAFPPNAGLTGRKDYIPDDYVVIGDTNETAQTRLTADGREVIYYEPKPVLRMNDPDKKVEEEPETMTEERRREMESQQQIEEWMIAEGASLGPIQQGQQTIDTLSGNTQPQQLDSVQLKIPQVQIPEYMFSPADGNMSVSHLARTAQQPPATTSSTIPPFITLKTLAPTKMCSVGEYAAQGIVTEEDITNATVVVADEVEGHQTIQSQPPTTFNSVESKKKQQGPL